MSQREREDDILAAIVRLETKMDQVLANDQDKERRLRRLEHWRWAHSLSGVAIIAVLTKLGIPLSGEH
jgi:hypothetical protein